MDEDRGIIYILANPGLFDPKTKKPLVKIGITKDLDSRLKALYDTRVPFPYECVFACEVDNYEKVERDLHKVLTDYRVNGAREFFNIDSEPLVPLFKHFAGYKDISPKVKKEVDKLDTLTKKVDKVPKGYDTYQNCKPLLNLPDGFRGGYFCIRLAHRHSVNKAKVYKMNGKTYYRKDLLLKQAKIEGRLKDKSQNELF
jgi:hypothetical protein